MTTAPPTAARTAHMTRRKLTLDERRARQRHEKQLRAMRDAAAVAHDHIDPSVPTVVAARRPALHAVAAATSKTHRNRLWSARVAYVAAVAVVVAAVVAAAGGGTPLWRQGWDATWLAGSAIAAGAGSWAGWQRRAAFGRRAAAAVVAGGCVVVALFVWGAATSVVIDGRVYANSSETARAWHLSVQARSDMYRLMEIDTLLSLDVAAARARYSEFEPATSELRSMSARWANHDPAEVPAPGYVDVTQAMAAASHWGAEALEGRRELLTQADVRLETEVRAAQDAMRDQVLTAGQLTVALSDLYGFDLTVSGRVAE